MRAALHHLSCTTFECDVQTVAAIGEATRYTSAACTIVKGESREKEVEGKFEN